MSTTKLWAKDFILIFIVNFFTFITFLLLMSVMSLFSTERFDATQSEAGLTTGIFVIATLIVRLFAGKYIDLLGRRKLLYISLIVFLDMANGLGPYLIGILLAFISYREMYFIMGIISIFSICLYYLLYGKKAQESKISSEQKRFIIEKRICLPLSRKILPEEGKQMLSIILAKYYPNDAYHIQYISSYF